MTSIVKYSLALGLPMLAACVSAATAGPNELTGTAQIAITDAPADGTCIEVTAAGDRTVTDPFNVKAGASSVFAMNGLPLGPVTFTAQAFSGTCAMVTAKSVANWISAPVTATVAVSPAVTVPLVMQRNGNASVSVNFSSEPAGITWQGTCSAACIAATGCPSGGPPGSATACLIPAAYPVPASMLDGIPDNQLQPPYAVDGNPGTRYSTGAYQVGGEYFAFDMCRTVSIDGINLLTAPVGSADSADVPSSYNVQVSTDGATWTEVATSSSPPPPQATITFPPTSARYVMVTQTGVNASSWWSIHEISPVCTTACVPGAKQCSGAIPQTCDATGNWVSGPACAIACSGGACSGSIAISAGSLAFATPCGTVSRPQTLTLANDGPTPITWSAALSVGNFYAIALTAINGNAAGGMAGKTIGSTMMNPGDVATLTVSPTPIPQYPPNLASPAPFADTIAITTNIPGDAPHLVQLSETPLGDVITWQPTSLNFQIPIGQVSSTQSVTVTNSANAGSPPANITVSSGAPSLFPITNATFQLSAQPQQVGVAFDAPGTPGPQTSPLTVSVAPTDVLCAPLPPPIAVSGTATEAGPVFAPQVLNFGTPLGLVNCGTTAAPMQVTVVNTGNQDFNVLSVAVDNTTYFQTPTMSSPSGLVLANGASSVTITVTPNAIPQTVAGGVPNFPAYSGNLTITTNANVPTPNFVVPLTMGAQGVIVSNSLAATTWSFPSTPYGSQSHFVVPVTNSGNSPVQVTLTGLGGGAFSLATNPAVETVTPGTLAITSVFSPSAAHTSYVATGQLQVGPIPGGALCAPLPPSWINPTITFEGSSP